MRMRWFLVSKYQVQALRPNFLSSSAWSSKSVELTRPKTKNLVRRGDYVLQRRGSLWEWQVSTKRSICILMNKKSQKRGRMCAFRRLKKESWQRKSCFTFRVCPSKSYWKRSPKLTNHETFGSLFPEFLYFWKKYKINLDIFRIMKHFKLFLIISKSAKKGCFNFPLLHSVHLWPIMTQNCFSRLELHCRSFHNHNKRPLL